MTNAKEYSEACQYNSAFPLKKKSKSGYVLN